MSGRNRARPGVPESHDADSAWPDLAGRIEGDRHVLAARIYFEDTDFSGLAYHGALIRFLERGRSDFLRRTGVHHRALAEGRFGRPLYFALRDLTVRFIAAARIDDVLEITTRVGALTAARIVLEQEIGRSERTIASATVEAVLIDGHGRPARLPEEIRVRLGAIG